MWKLIAFIKSLFAPKKQVKETRVVEKYADNLVESKPEEPILQAAAQEAAQAAAQEAAQEAAAQEAAQAAAQEAAQEAAAQEAAQEAAAQAAAAQVAAAQEAAAKAAAIEEVLSLLMKKALSKYAKKKKPIVKEPIPENTPIVKESNLRPKYLFFDTETNSAFNDRSALQLAWVVTDAEGTEITAKSYILKRNVPIDPFAQSVNGINQCLIDRDGIDPIKVYSEFLQDVERVSVLVGHNVSFDLKTVENDLYTFGLENSLTGKEIICTMNATRDLMQRKDKNGHLKNPRLEELAGHLLFNDPNREFPGAHDALYDTRLTMKCFFKMEELSLSGALVSPCVEIETKPTAKKSKVNVFKRINSTPPKVMPALLTEEELTRSYPCNPFSEKNVLITGDLFSIGIDTRDEGKAIITRLGGVPLKTIVVGTDFVIIGEACGPSKMEKLVNMQDKGHKVICLDAALFKIICEKNNITL